jgi:hypothetical protein
MNHNPSYILYIFLIFVLNIIYILFTITRYMAIKWSMMKGWFLKFILSNKLMKLVNKKKYVFNFKKQIKSFYINIFIKIKVKKNKLGFLVIFGRYEISTKFNFISTSLYLD